MATKTLARAIDGARQGNAAYVDTFARLGLSMDDLNKMSDTDAIFAVRDALSQMGAGLDRTTIATKLLGRGAQTMAAWYSQSATQMMDTNKLLKDSGLIWDDKTIEQYDKARKAQAELAIAMTGISETIATDVLPALTPFVGLLGDMLRFVKPIAPVVVPLTAALAGFVGVVKGYNLLKDAWLGSFAKLIPKIAANVVAEGTETAAIAAQTAAIEANSLVRAENALLGLGGAPTGLMGAGLPAGAAGLGMAGTAVAATAAAVSAGLAAAFIYYSATYKENPMSPSAVTVTGGPSGAGRYLGTAGEEQIQRDISTHQMSYQAGYTALSAIASELAVIKPTAQNGGAIDAYAKKLKDIGEQYPEVKDRAAEMTKALEKQKPAWREAVAAAKAAMEELRKGILDSSKSVFEGMSRAMQAGLLLTSTELAALAAANPFKGTPGWKPEANADNAALGTSKHPVKYHKFARGGIGTTKDGEIGIFGEAGPEPFAIGDAAVALARGGGRRVIHVDFRGANFSAFSPKELMEGVGREVAIALGGTG
jgi:hypothetical protein